MMEIAKRISSSLLLTAVVSLPSQGCREVHPSFYPTLADAANSGEITRGWLPDFLPGAPGLDFET